MQNLECACTFLGNGGLVFPRAPKKFNFPSVKTIVHKKRRPRFQFYFCYQLLCEAGKIILYLWVSVSQFVNKENGPNQNLQIGSVIPCSILGILNYLPAFKNQKIGHNNKILASSENLKDLTCTGLPFSYSSSWLRLRSSYLLLQGKLSPACHSYPHLLLSFTLPSWSLQTSEAAIPGSNTLQVLSL